MRDILILIAIVWIAASRTHAEIAATSPATTQSQSAEAKRAFDDLAAYYADEKNVPDVSEAMEQLKSTDPSKRPSAGAYLLALPRQSAADERNGRAQWRSLPFWGGGAESRARQFRENLAQQFGDAAQSDESLACALWLINEDP